MGESALGARPYGNPGNGGFRKFAAPRPITQSRMRSPELFQIAVQSMEEVIRLVPRSAAPGVKLEEIESFRAASNQQAIISAVGQRLRDAEMKSFSNKSMLRGKHLPLSFK